MFYIDNAVIRAASLFTGKGKDGRAYLAGLFFEFEDGSLRVTATDGHRLFTGIAATDVPENERFPDMIIPNEALKRAAAPKKTTAIPMEVVGETCTINGVLFDPIDMSFPDWRRLNPGVPSGEKAFYDPAYVGDFAKAANELGVKYPYIGHNGDNPALVSFGDRTDCLALIMPVRRPIDEKKEPDHWKALSVSHFESAFPIRQDVAAE